MPASPSVERFNTLHRHSKQAAQKMLSRRQPFKMQVQVYRTYTVELSRGVEPIPMALWELGFIMKVSFDGSPRRYPLLMSSKGDLVGFVQHKALSATQSLQVIETLSVLGPTHFATLTDEDMNKLLLELQMRSGGALGQLAS